MYPKRNHDHDTRTGATAGRGLLAAVLAGALFLPACGNTRFSEADPSAAPETFLAELKEHKDEIDHATTDMLTRIDTFNAARQPGERTIQFSEVFTDDLTAEQRDVLNNMLAQEKDVSYKSLLQKIIQDRERIRGLQERIAALEQQLGDRFVIAGPSDTHHELALNYLTREAGVDPSRARELLAQVDQTDELLPGNKVWFFYDERQDAFRTYVTQGDADRTPIAVRRALQRRLMAERDSAQAEVTTLLEEKAELEEEIAVLQEDKAELEANIATLSDDLAWRENSLFYHAANVQDLKHQGVLSTVFKRVRNVRGIQYEAAVDLREAKTITLAPQTFGLQRIRSVRLLPAIYEEGRDFTVETSDISGNATVVILDGDLFKGKEILFAVGG